MNENSTNTGLLIRFLDGELEGDELESLKKTLAENPALREELENLRMATEAVKSYGFRSKISLVHSGMMQELKGEKPKTGISRMIFQYSIRIAAVLIILFGISITYQYINITPEKLFNENFQAFDLHETRGLPASTLEDLYKKWEMDAVIQQFNTLKSPQPEDYFLAGNAFLGTHQSARAIEAFTALQEFNKINHAHYFDEDAEYYLAFSFLGNQEPGKALPLFEKIYADPNHAYNKKISAWFLRKVKKTVRS
jgi:hypothetical protein